jgi:hypothetical protein
LIAQLLFHDQTAVAWFIVAAYLAAAASAFVAAGNSPVARERRFWLSTAALLLLLGLNKQLDLQSFLTDAGRSLARHEGWYGQRRLVQEAFILLLAAGAACSVVLLAHLLRRSATSVRLAAFGIVLLFGFVVMRAASFHHMDYWVTRTVAGVRSGWWLELAGIGIVAASALTARERRARSAVTSGTLDGPADYAPESNDGAQGG